MNPRDLSQNPGCPRSFCLGSAKITSRKNPLRSKVFLGSLIWFLVAVQLAIAVIRAFLDFRNREACCMSFQGDQNGAAMGSTSATKIPRSGAIRCPWKTLAGKEYKRRGQASATRPIDRMLEHAIPNRGKGRRLVFCSNNMYPLLRPAHVFAARQGSVYRSARERY